MTKEFIFNFAMQHPIVTFFIIRCAASLICVTVKDMCDTVRASTSLICQTIMECKRKVYIAEKKKSKYSGNSIGFKCVKSPD